MFYTATILKIVDHSRFIARTLGHDMAADYLRDHDVGFEAAYQILFNRIPVR